jgi:hypothetical protein
LNIFERKVYRRIPGPVYDNEKENTRILTNKEIYAIVKKPTIAETIRQEECIHSHTSTTHPSITSPPSLPV